MWLSCAGDREKPFPLKKLAPGSARTPGCERRVASFDDIADRDLPGIIAYHLPRSREKAVAILSEYDRIIELLERSLHTFRPRAHGWRIYTFRSGTYALYYREMDDFWLVAGVFHSRRDPDWILAQLVIREAREDSS